MGRTNSVTLYSKCFRVQLHVLRASQRNAGVCPPVYFPYGTKIEVWLAWQSAPSHGLSHPEISKVHSKQCRWQTLFFFLRLPWNKIRGLEDGTLLYLSIPPPSCDGIHQVLVLLLAGVVWFFLTNNKSIIY